MPTYLFNPIPDDHPQASDDDYDSPILVDVEQVELENGELKSFDPSSGALQDAIPLRGITSYVAEHCRDNRRFLYRKMSPEEAGAVMQNKTFDLDGGTGHNNRNNFSEFRNNQLNRQQQEAQQVLEVALKKRYCENMGTEAVPQFRSGRMDHEARDAFHYEGIIEEGGITQVDEWNAVRDVPRNKGISREGVLDVNTVKAIKVVSSTTKAALKKALRKLRPASKKALVAIQIVMSGTDVVIGVINDKGKFGRNTVMALADVTVSTLCAVVGGALGSLLGPKGTIVGGIIGGIAGSYLGKFVGDLICMAAFGRPTAEGPGAPPMNLQPLRPPHLGPRPLGPPTMNLRPLGPPKLQLHMLLPPIFGMPLAAMADDDDGNEDDD